MDRELQFARLALTTELMHKPNGARIERHNRALRARRHLDTISPRKFDYDRFIQAMHAAMIEWPALGEPIERDKFHSNHVFICGKFNMTKLRELAEEFFT